MKEKLIELLLSAEKVADEEGFCNCHKSRPKAELIADYLIQNGVVVPPCKVGDTVSTDCKDYPNCNGCPIDASGGCDRA